MFGFSQSATKGASRSRSKSKEKRPQGSYQTEGYSCTLYKDFLVFYGGKYGEEIIDQAFVYNLREKRMEANQTGGGYSFAKFSHCAYLLEKQNLMIFFGGSSNTQQNSSVNSTLRLYPNGHGLGWAQDYGMPKSNMPSPIIDVYQDRLMYVYQPGEENGNFGVLQAYDFVRCDWQQGFTGIQGDFRLSEPSDCAIFCDNNLYLFAQNEDQKNSLKRGDSEKILEDVYVLDLVDQDKKPRWRKITSGGQAPGLLKDISMTAANGMIYVVGTSGEESQTVFWTYDTKEEIWNEVENIGTLTAGPNQRAVVYKEKLLIVDWNYRHRLVNIQSQNLNNLTFVVPSIGHKQVCKDQPDSFIQQYKSLYNGRLFADITFEVEGEEIPAHKAILAYRSDYFMRMFNSGMSESHSIKISIPNIKSEIFKALLQYIYCNEIELDEQLALDLIPVVDEYLMKGLKGLCEKYLCKQLRKENMVDMLIVADRHEIEELKKSCFRFILKNLGNIDENEEMMKLSKSLFIELLKFNNTSSDSQRNNTKQEEEKSNSFEPIKKTSSKKASSPKMSSMSSQAFSIGATPSFNYGATTGSSFGDSASFSYGTKASARKASKSRSKSPASRPAKKY